MKDPETVLRSVFQEINVSDDYIPEALDRLNFDSQEGTYLSWENMKKFKAKPMNEKQSKRLTRMAEMLGVAGDRLVKIS